MRQVRKASPGNPKFSAKEAERIRKEYEAGSATQNELAVRYETSALTIRSIIKRWGAYAKR